MSGTQDCVFCMKPLGDVEKEITELTKKGCDGIAWANTKRNQNIKTIPGQKVHTKCHQQFCNEKYIALAIKKRDRSEDECGPSTSRSIGSKFDFENNCLFYGQGMVPLGHRAENKLIKVQTLSFQKSIVDACESRGDSLSEVVKGRIEYVQDLFAADSVYHDQCNINFVQGVKYYNDLCPE